MPQPRFAAALLLALAPALVAAARGPLDDLMRMSEAVAQLNYQGTFVYDHAGMLETMRIVHQADANGEREHLVSLDGDMREVVRDRDGVICILGDAKPLLLSRVKARTGFPGRPQGDISHLQEHYTFSHGPLARVAGRPARTLEIRPRDDLRYGYRLWLDQATGLPLRTELVGADGQALERIVFTQIEVLAAADPNVAEAIRARKAWANESVKRAVTRPLDGVRRWQVTELPQGFRLADYRTFGAAGAGADHLVFSDGLATVSVYVEPLNAEQPLNGVRRLGAVSTFALVHEAHQVVVVGDVPMATAHIIGSAVQPLAGGAQ
jgi:sigma-E factor negative regulatory protein RseB